MAPKRSKPAEARSGKYVVRYRRVSSADLARDVKSGKIVASVRTSARTAPELTGAIRAARASGQITARQARVLYALISIGWTPQRVSARLEAFVSRPSLGREGRYPRRATGATLEADEPLDLEGAFVDITMMPKPLTPGTRRNPSTPKEERPDQEEGRKRNDD